MVELELMTKKTVPFSSTLLEKAEGLIQTGKIVRIAEDVYYAKSVHDPTRYSMVKKADDLTWTCVCRGFQRRKICSHAIAALMLESAEKARLMGV